MQMNIPDQGLGVHRFHVPQVVAEDWLELPRDEAHHACKVLRLRAGERVVVLDGAGLELGCEVEAVRGGRVSLRVRQRLRHPRPRQEITLIQAVLKGRAMEWLVQKATELGVARIVPITAERTVSQLDSGGAVGRREKWRAIAVEGIKQCGTVWLPEIALPVTVSEYLEQGTRSELVLVASLQPDAVHPRRCLESFMSARGRYPESVSVWIGPEGDFTRVELGRMKEAGACPVTLGRSVLRSETAALYLISVLQYELGSGTGKAEVGREDPAA